MRRDKMVRLATRHRFPLPLPLLALLGVLAMASPLAAQSYPSGMIRIVNGNAPGTPPDIVSRVVANDLSESEHWYVVVENKVGAIGTIGAAEVLKQPADGQTILSIALPSAAAPALIPTLNFRLDSDFLPVAKLASAYHVLVVHPSVSARSLSELVALLKSEPDKFTFSSGGFGTPAHLAGELFKLQTGVRATHVPYQALPRAIGDLLNGTNQYQFISPLPVVDLINAGKLRAIAVTGPARLPALKDVPTVGEAGFPDLIIQDWFGLLVKRGTPETVIVQLNQAVNRSLQKPRVREAIEKMAAEPAGGTPEEFGKFVSSQLAYWGNVVKNSGITIQQ
ncbi:MAG: tripartite tricarboxylate transporter substrate binding protein [Alphaproteobacteria bacterium]|nr:MAG: tripartite tricarboxylate transporter substrate binding protein [Alphaproteobacteria bacterium]